MSETMIALLSGQRMQNIIPVLQRGRDYERLWLIRSSDADVAGSHFALALQHTKDALEDVLDVESADASVDAYSVAETQAAVHSLLRSTSSATVNFTGGTKCMSVGAYLAARDAGTVALYVDTANQKLIWYYPDGRVENEGFNLAGRMKVRTYLRAYGHAVDEERTERHAMDKEAVQAARRLRTLWPGCVDALDECRRAISGRRKALLSLEPPLATILEEAGLVTRDAADRWSPTQRGKQFLTGLWLDGLVYACLLDSGEFDDVQLELRLRGSENELDVMATRRGQLGIVECKSGDLGGQTTLNKLQAIRSRLGTFARTCFVTSRMDGDVDHQFRERARRLGVRRIVARDALSDIVELVKSAMRGVA